MTFLSSLAPALTAVAALYSVSILFRADEAPGSGLVGGLLLAAALVLFGRACGANRLRKAIRFDPAATAAVGMLIAAAAGLAAWYAPLPYLSAMILRLHPFGSEIAISTVVAFEIGVYLASAGAVVAAALSLMERDE